MKIHNNNANNNNYNKKENNISTTNFLDINNSFHGVVVSSNNSNFDYSKNFDYNEKKNNEQVN